MEKKTISSEETVQERRIKIDRDEEQTSEVVQLRTIIGGKQPPKRGKNWLRDLKSWTVFNARILNPPSAECLLFQLRVKYANSCELFCWIPKEPQPHIRYFNMEHFSNDYELNDILEEGIDGTEGDRSNIDGGLEVNADIKTDNTVEGETR